MPRHRLTAKQREERIRVTDIRALDGKIRPTISGPLAVYVRDLARTGLYGSRETEVVRALLRNAICGALETKLIPIRNFAKPK